MRSTPINNLTALRFLIHFVGITFLWGFIAAPYIACADSVVDEVIKNGAVKSATPSVQRSVIIDKENIDKFAQFFPEELIPVFKNGDLQVSVSDQLLPKLSLQKMADDIPLDEEGALPSELKLHDGILFDGRTLDASTSDAKTTAQKILWNMQAIEWSQHFFSFDFTLSSFEKKKIVRTMQGVFSKIYPPLLGFKNLNEQLFREKIQITHPIELKGYSWFTFRLIGKNQDLVWIYSPFIKRERQIAASLRDDELFFSTLSPSDLMVFSGKPTQFVARLIDTKELLLPISVVTTPQQGASPPCVSITPEKFEGRLVTRKTFRLELTNRDPYSSIGRIMLYVDSESYLPLYRANFDRTGSVRSVVMGSAVIQSTEGMSPRFIYSKTSSFDIQNDLKTEFSVRGGSICKELPPAWTLSDFDPYRQ